MSHRGAADGRKRGKSRVGKKPKRCDGSRGKGGIMKRIVNMRRKHKNSVESYRSSIHKILKSVDPEIGISSRATSVMNSLMNDILEKLASEAARLARSSKKATIASREIQAAVRLTLPGELGMHAASQGKKAVMQLEP